MDNVVKCTVMLADIKEWADMNAVYGTFFKKERLPARSAFGASGLVLTRASRLSVWLRLSENSLERLSSRVRRILMNIDRRVFIAALGGAVTIEAMSSEALADALEHK